MCTFSIPGRFFISSLRISPALLRGCVRVRASTHARAGVYGVILVFRLLRNTPEVHHESHVGKRDGEFFRVRKFRRRSPEESQGDLLLRVYKQETATATDTEHRYHLQT